MDGVFLFGWSRYVDTFCHRCFNIGLGFVAGCCLRCFNNGWYRIRNVLWRYI